MSGAEAISAEQRLFRPEVLAARNAEWLGAIHLAQPLSRSIVAVISLCLMMGLVAFAVLGNVTRKARIGGVTVPAGGSISVMAPAAGTLARNFVREGQHVVAGEPLFELSTEHHSGSGELTALISQQLAVRLQAIETERRARLAQDADRRRLLVERLQTQAAEEAQLTQEIKLAQRRQALAQKSLGMFEVLQGSGFVSASQVQQKQEDLIDVDGKLSGLIRGQLQLASNRQSLKAELDTLANSLAADMAQLQRSEASLRQEMVETSVRKTNTIVAPQAGRITTVVYEAGQSLGAGQVVATLVPDTANQSTDIAVHLYAPSRAAGFVAPGQQVLVRYQAFPYQKFGLQPGVITDVSRTPLAPGELPPHLASTILAQQGGGSEALYRVKVTLKQQAITVYGKQQPLKPGMTLEADVVQDRRPIWEWVAEPLLAASARR